MFIFSLGLYRHTDMRDTRGREWFLCRIRHPRYGKYRTTAFHHALYYHNSNYSYVIPVYLLNDILISIHEVLPFCQMIYTCPALFIIKIAIQKQKPSSHSARRTLCHDTTKSRSSQFKSTGNIVQYGTSFYRCLINSYRVEGIYVHIRHQIIFIGLNIKIFKIRHYLR